MTGAGAFMTAMAIWCALDFLAAVNIYAPWSGAGPLAQRIEFNARSQMLFVNFEGLTVDRPEDIEAIEREVMHQLGALGKRANVVVNYDHFSIRPELMDDYDAMVRRLTERYYARVTRYGASGFVKARLAALPVV